MTQRALASDPIEPSCFHRDDMSRKARKARGIGERRKLPPSSKAAARGTNTRPVAAAIPPLRPTFERRQKPDAPQAPNLSRSHWRSPPPIERMRDRRQFSPDPAVNQAMFLAAEKLAGLFMAAGLRGGVRAQDMTRLLAGGGEPAYGMPIDEAAAHCRQAFRKACALMGWHDAFPHRGAGRLTVMVVCYEMALTEAAAIYRPGGRTESRLGAGMEVLREGLFELALHWRFLSPKDVRQGETPV
jgi:hypothetical protein